MTQQLTNEQRVALITRLENGAKQTGASLRGGVMVGAVAMGAVAGFAAHQHEIAFAVGIGAFGVGLIVLAIIAGRRNSPARMLPVVDALRTAPETIGLVEHYETSGDRRRLFKSHFIRVATPTHRLVIRADQDWPPIYQQLCVLCPNAKHVEHTVI
ncbi:MAG TPA: hypothetical protein VGM88_34990 [Kofleriaceae bacterium]|jgi:hypothetical protein